jgi:threonine/homoserine/homoserine lactone efflux protein
MSLGHLIAFNVALLAAILSPGPAFLIAVKTTLSAGRKAGIAVGGGLGLMASTWTLLALLGLDAVFVLFP